MSIPSSVRSSTTALSVAWICALVPDFVQAQTATVPSGTSTFLQVLFGLVVVLGLMAAAAWTLKRLGMARPAAHAPIRIVGGVSVGTRERVMVVEVADQWIVVGVAPGSVNFIKTVPRQDTSGAAETDSETATAMPRADQGPALQFAHWLKDAIDRRKDRR